MSLQTLQSIGLTEGEIKVYEALLELGECTKTALAKKSRVAPSNIYDITNRLLDKGIISKVEKNGIAHFSPANPKQILRYIEDKHKEVDEEKSIVQSLLPELLLKFNRTEEPVKVEVYQNWKGMKTVFDDLLSECKRNTKNFVFGASKGEQSEQADRFFVKYSRLRAEKGIITNIIFNEKLRKRKARIEFFEKSTQYNIRFLKQQTPAEILLYKDSTLIIILVNDPIVIRIRSKEVMKSFKEYFNVMWNQAAD